ncbi:MAG: DUF5606 domain-containing protein [Saprospiraceae bacterium]
MVLLENIIAISGSGSLFKLITTRANGLILEEIGTEKRNFYASRNTQFSPLESIGIYTLSDNIPLSEVYHRFVKIEDQNTIPTVTSSDADIRAFFENNVQEYDRYRVHIKDMKKCIKWYHFLAKYILLVVKPEVNKEKKIEESEETDETK